MAASTGGPHHGASNHEYTPCKNSIVDADTDMDSMGMTSEDSKLPDMDANEREGASETSTQNVSGEQEQPREPNTTRYTNDQRDATPAYTSYNSSQSSTPNATTVNMEIETGANTQELKAPQYLRDCCASIRQHCPGPEGERKSECFGASSFSPPITKTSLSELDITSIVANPKLRHDVNFDRELHFRPNLDGQKGKQKAKAAEDYWLALEGELELYKGYFQGTLSVPSDTESQLLLVKVMQRRIPTMFRTVREILINLLPEKDHATVEEHLDTDQLMQEIARGVCDLPTIARWLAQLLKRHCAPMRDEWLERMVERISVGARSGAMDVMVSGLKEMFNILEAMKLDVANHQVRNLRLILIEDTYNFETKYHQDRVRRGRIDHKQAQDWLHSNSHPIPRVFPKSIDQTRVAHFVSGFLRLLLTGCRGPVPETFNLDADRIRTIRSDLSDMVHFDICNRVFDDLLQLCGVVGGPSDSARLALQIDLLAIVGETSGSKRAWANSVENVAIEIVRQGLRLANQTKTYDAELVRLTEVYLRNAFQHPLSHVYLETTARLELLLYPRVMDAVESHLNASPVDIFNSFIPFAPPPPPPPPPPSFSIRAKSASLLNHRPPPPLPQSRPDPLADMTRRISHIAVLHWKTWSSIVYIVHDQQQQLSSHQQQRSISEPASNTLITTTHPKPSHADPLEQRSAISPSPSPSDQQQPGQQGQQQPPGDCDSGVSELTFRQRRSAP